MLYNGAVAIVAFMLSNAKSEERLTPPNYAEDRGVHWWLVEVPSDLIDGEYLSTCWSFPSVDGEPSRRGETGLHFKGVPPGTTVKLFVWFQPWLTQRGKNMEGMKFCVQFQDNKGELQERHGILGIPDGYVDLHAYAESGERTDGAWIMMMTNPNNEPERGAIVLDFHYVSVQPRAAN